MASPEELVPSLPDTLPEDFSEWDGEASPASLPVNSREWEVWEASHSFAKPPKPVSHSAERKTIAPPVVEKPRDKRAAAAPPAAKPQTEFDREPAPVPLRVNSNEWEAWAASFGKPAKPLGHSGDRTTVLSPAGEKPRDSRRGPSASIAHTHQALTTELVDESPSRALRGLEASHTATETAVALEEPVPAEVEETKKSAEAAPASAPQADEGLFQSFSTKNIEAIEEPAAPRKKKKSIVLAATSACLILPALIVIPLLHHGAKAAAKQPVEPISTSTDTTLETNTPQQSAAELPTQDKPPAAGERQQPSDSKPVTEEAAASSQPAPTEAETQMMNDQLTAPTRIPQDANKQVADNAPPAANFGADGLGGGSATVGIFNGHAQPVIRSSRPVAISSGVATGLLIQKTSPVYPAIAKSARVAGTVELHAVIAKNGTIKNLQVVSGPEMLRQAAVDAVRSWRYRPYKLDNQPTEVETTINVVFTLGA